MRRRTFLAAGTILAVAAAGGKHASARPAAPSRMGASAVAYARTQVGKPYVWGAEGPDSFDCSGLVWAAWRQAGLEWGRTNSQQQWAELPHVGSPRPGDLVFFAGGDGTPSAPGHVGIVIGGGRMVEAYAPGYPVRISTYGRSSSPPGDQVVVGFARPS